MTTFIDWLLNELEIRDFSQAALARKSKMTIGAILHVLSG